MFNKSLDQGQAGDNAGALLRGIKREDVERGQVLAKPGSITPHTEFEAEVYVLTKEEGGRHTPFLSGYRPQFYFRTTDVTGAIELPEGTEMCMPGDRTSIGVSLIQPIAMDEGLRFAIREGGRTVGAGVGHEDHQVGLRPLTWRSRRSASASRATTTRSSTAPPSEIVETATADRRDGLRPGAAADGANVYCVIRSPFKDKDSREHFEIRTHKRLIDIHQPTPEDGRLAHAARPARPASTSRSSSEPLKAIIGRKLGMTQLFTEDGALVPGHRDRRLVRARWSPVRSQAEDGYDAVQLAFEEVAERKR